MASRITEAAMKKRISLVEDALRKNPESDLKEFVFELAANFGCCAKTAKEYINIAKWRIANGSNNGLQD